MGVRLQRLEHEPAPTRLARRPVLLISAPDQNHYFAGTRAVAPQFDGSMRRTAAPVSRAGSRIFGSSAGVLWITSMPQAISRSLPRCTGRDTGVWNRT